MIYSEISHDLGISNEMTQQERAVVTPQMIQGFNGEHFIV